MKLNALDIPIKNDLARQFATDGLVVLPRIELPATFDPPETDVAFLKLHDGICEIHIGSNTRYRGLATNWQAIDARPTGPGRTRFVTSIRGDFFSALKILESMIRQSEPNDSNGPVTDMAAVRDGIRNIGRPVYLDEQDLSKRLKSRIRGQDAALDRLSAVVVRHLERANPARPGVIFSIGPSGVGKTRTAEVLAEILGKADDRSAAYRYLRLDMNEYQEEHRLSQLLGAPQGFVGHGEGSQLVDALRASGGRLVLLFDEIDKAHPKILRALMNAMDAGRLATAEGRSGSRELDCRYAIFIFTSNLDAKGIVTEIEARNAFGNRAVEDEICRRRLLDTGIGPEIVGRLGSFLVYRPLPLDIRAEIMAISIAEVAREYSVEVGYIEPQVIIHLMEKIGSTDFGVRPERYLIDDELGGAFARIARQHHGGTVRIVGPPFDCVPLPSPDEISETPSRGIATAS